MLGTRYPTMTLYMTVLPEKPEFNHFRVEKQRACRGSGQARRETEAGRVNTDPIPTISIWSIMPQNAVSHIGRWGVRNKSEIDLAWKIMKKHVTNKANSLSFSRKCFQLRTRGHEINIVICDCLRKAAVGACVAQIFACKLCPLDLFGSKQLISIYLETASYLYFLQINDILLRSS